MSLIKEFFRYFAIITGWPLYKLVYKTRIWYEDEAGRENKRIKGPALIVSNHFSGLDYMITLFHYFGRKVYVIMLEEVFNKSAFLRWSISIIGGIKADRDIKSMRFIDDGVKVLNKGNLLQIYPEAHNSTDGLMHDFKPSYIMIALRADVPIVPLIVDGQYGIKKRAHAIIGKSIRLRDICASADPSREEIQQLNEIVQNKAIELKAVLDKKVAEERSDK